MSEVDFALSIALGIGLAAATGFRVFVPLLVLSAAAQADYLSLGEGFAWIATPSALVMLAIAALAEVLAYYIPGVDNVLDSLAGPAAVIAGIVVSAAVMSDMAPMLKYALAIIAGGGAAALTQGATTVIRAHSTAFTGGFGNPVVSTAELGGSLAVSLLAILAPYIALLLVILFCVAIYRTGRKLLRKKQAP